VVATVVLASEVLATVEDDEVELAAEAAVLVVVAWVVVASCYEIDTIISSSYISYE